MDAISGSAVSHGAFLIGFHGFGKAFRKGIATNHCFQYPGMLKICKKNKRAHREVGIRNAKNVSVFWKGM
jgi:hypothetical protein